MLIKSHIQCGAERGKYLKDENCNLEAVQFSLLGGRDLFESMYQLEF